MFARLLLIGESRDNKQRAGGRGARDCLEAEAVSLSLSCRIVQYSRAHISDAAHTVL